MPFFRKFAAGWKSLLHKDRFECEMDEELRHFFNSAVQQKISAGMSRPEALRAARIEMGGMEAPKQQIRNSTWESSVETFWQDLRFALRMLGKSPGFTAIAIFSLALGIGANTAIFTIINGLILKSLPVRDPQQLVSFGQAFGGGSVDGIEPGPLDIFPYEFYQQLVSRQPPFAGICAFASFPVEVSVRLGGTSANSVQQATAHLVSGNFFSVIGATTILGRPLQPSDEAAPGSNPVAVVSYHYWEQALATDPSAIGRTITVNGTAFTIVGVTQKGFFGATLDDRPPDLWVPLSMQEQVTLRPTLLGSHGLYWLHFIARQSPATSIVQAQAWVDLQLHQYMTDRESAGLTPDRRQEIQKIYVELLPAGTGLSDLRQNYQQPLSVLMGVVVLVLLIACANLANFLLARTSSREREISTRLALGAGRWRVIRQILTETLLLSLLGGALGLFLAFWGTRALLLFMVSGATHTPFSPYPDWRVLLFTFTVSLFTGLLFGIAPALRISRMSLAPSLKSTSRSVAGEGSRFAQLLPKILVAAQVALSLVLLMGAGLFARTLRNLEHADYGFQRQNLLLTEINPANAGYKPEQLDAFYGRVVDRLGALPGVRSVTLSGAPPISKGSWNSPVYPSGHVPEPHEDNSSLINRILPRYFETVGIPLLAGRSIDNHDATGAAHVVVVNQSFANHFFPKSEAIGQRVSFAEPDVKGDWEIVGIVRDSKYNNPRETPQRMIYLPVLQLTQGGRYAYSLEVLTVGDPAPLAEGVRQTLARINPDLPVGKIRTIGQHMELFIDRETLVSELSIFFSLLALLLSSIGLYGVMTYNVVRRTSEIGIRMALGAQGGSVLWMVLKESLRLLAIGTAIGIPAALGATRLIRAVLFGLSASDPLTLVGAILIISVLTLLAAYLPARRAMLVDPIISLRYD